MIKQCVKIFTLDLLILCLQVKLSLMILVCFHFMILWQYNFIIIKMREATHIHSNLKIKQSLA